jgi:hypothetical protein
MTGVWASLTTFLLLCLSAGAARHVRPRLPETLRTRETIETIQLVIGMLVTFAALVLGLLTASVKTSYERAERDRHAYALHLIELDQCLRDYGDAAEPIRDAMRSYTAAVIASTWPDEPRPMGVRYPDTSGMPRIGASPVLGDLMEGVGAKIRQLDARTAAEIRTADDCRAGYREVSRARLAVIEDADTALATPFFCILVFWLTAIFLAFGLAAPRNRLALSGILLCAMSLSSAIFVIVDLSHPYQGLMSIPSTDMREALARMIGGAGE